MTTRIAILAYGSRGDVQPFLALAAGLLRAGCAVRLLAPHMRGNPAALAEELQGLEIVELEGDIDALAQSLAQQAGMNPMRTLRVMSEFVFPLAQRVYHTIVNSCQDVQGIVHSFLFTDAGRQLARMLDVPDFSVQFFPVLAATGDFPGMTFPRLGSRSAGLAAVTWWVRSYNWLTHQVNTAMFRYGGRFLYGLLRRRDASLPRLGQWPFAGPLQDRTPLLFAFSPQVVPRAPEWPGNVHMLGYFNAPESAWQPPQNLQRFLEAGDPPVYIGFGSMQPQDSHALKELCLDALRITGLRGLLALPGMGAAEAQAAPLYLQVGHVPHTWLFPRMAAVVHHGGAGTSGAAFQAGVPQVIAPVFGDQPFWAQRAFDLGAAPRPFPLRKLTAQRLAQALELAVRDTIIRSRAQTLGERIRQEDGVSQALGFIQQRCG